METRESVLLPSQRTLPPQEDTQALLYKHFTKVLFAHGSLQVPILGQGVVEAAFLGDEYIFVCHGGDMNR